MENEERLANRAARKIKVKKTAIITPFPISGAVVGDNVKGSILKYMFPSNGMITKMLFKVIPKPKDKVVVKLSTNDIDRKFTIDELTKSFDLDTAIMEGECIDVSIVESDKPINEIWVSFLWVPAINKVELRSFIEEAESNERV